MSNLILTDPNRILTVKEAASILRVSKSKLYQMVKEGKVPHVSLGGRIIFPEAKLMEWINASVCGGGIHQ